MSTPIIQDPGALSGAWRLELPDGSRCDIQLRDSAQALAAGSLAAPMLAAEGRCHALPSLQGWRPAPLGLELTDAAGFAVLTFEQVGPQAYLSSASGARLVRA